MEGDPTSVAKPLALTHVAECSPMPALPPPSPSPARLTPSQWMVDAIAEREQKAERSLMHRFDICRVRHRDYNQTLVANLTCIPCRD